MAIVYKSRFLTRAEVWYEEEPGDLRGADWISYQQRSQPVPGAKTTAFPTYVIDLARSQEQLLANLDKETAYKIRRARERDKIVCETCDPQNPAVMNRFEQVYNQFAAMKRLAPLERSRMASMAAAGRLELSVAKDPHGQILVYHANHRDRHRASGMLLASLFRAVPDSAERNLIGRANRYLTWCEMVRYQEQGLKYFDFGGWYHGTDPAMLQVNDFKRGFGGTLLGEYHCEQIVTLKGRLLLGTARLWQGAKSLRRGVNPAIASPGNLASTAEGTKPAR